MLLLHIFTFFIYYKKKKTISKKFCFLGCQSYFCQTVFHHYWLKTAIFGLNRQYFSGKAWELKMLIYYTKQKNISKKFVPLAARAIFICPLFTILCLKIATIAPLNARAIFVRLFSPLLIKNSYFWTKSSIFFWQSMGTQNANFTHFYFILLL